MCINTQPENKWVAGSAAMNWDDLRYFLALAGEGTVSGAGRALSVKHTTVARRITSLETQLGSRLFDRTPEGYVLTQVGENLYPHALAVETQMQSAEREVFGMDAELKGSLTLTASPDVLDNLIVPKLPAFKQDYPSININLLGFSHLANLALREADIAVRMTPKPPEYLIGRKVLPMQHGIYGSNQYLKQANNQKCPHKVILWDGDSIPEWVQEHFPDAEVVMRTNDIHSMVSAVHHGMGVARIPCYLGDNNKNMIRLNLRLTPSTWGVWVLSHVDLRSAARVRVCKEFLIEAIESQRELILGEQSRYL